MNRLLTLLTLALAFTVPAISPAQAQSASVTVTVNGQPIQFDQPPVERAGRVYVPLRGVFEHLGASVVYENGQINATRGSTTVQLNIGSTTAIVNGQQTALDSPPFLIGARTLVPLRFVAQALGANVDYNNSNQTVAITAPNMAPNETVTAAPNRPPAPPPQAMESWDLVHIAPPPDSTVEGMRPRLSASFPERVRPDTVTVRLDGRTVTSDAYVSARDFTFNPSYDLPPGTHRIELQGRTESGRPFRTSWSFRTRPPR